MTVDLAAFPALTTGVAATWRDLEERYLQGRYAGAGPVDGVHVVAGSLPVLVCAGHAVTHVRDGARKPADIATGGLAELLAARAGVWALTATGLPVTDPNYDVDGTFKQRLLGLLPQVAAVVDLHGMKDGYGPDVCLGRGFLPHLADPLVEMLRTELEAAGFWVAVDDPFRADRPTTLTSTAQAAGVAAVQIELARRARSPWDDEECSERLVDALTRAVSAVRPRS